ncbi:MAG TPA: energy transducer TonB [Candidatus Polarisedimenticolaceae bacterium]|nr:energy transducer TonB [Candidatus Polarisedimenticolaceae bacterium]
MRSIFNTATALAFVAVTASLVPSFAKTAELKALEREAVTVGPGIEPPTLRSESHATRPDTPSGTVTLKLLVDTQGEIRKMIIVDSSRSSLERVARELMSSRHYAPATRNGVPVAVWWTTDVTFRSTQDLIDAALRCEPPKEEPSPSEDRNAEVQLPANVRKVEPEFSGDLVRRGPGSAVLQCHINVCGRVESCVPLSATAPAFIEPATKAVLQWIYQPAMQYGKPVAVYLTVRVDFRSQ